MPKNLYNFTGPLDPVEHGPVCISRSKEIDKVIGGLLKGDYWVILGPRQIGKTTLMRQLKHELSVYPSIYIDLESAPGDDEAFYNWLINTITENFPEKPQPPVKADSQKDFGHKMNFYNFLKTFRSGKDKKIILFFDEIEKVPAVHSFLNMWRKIFNERMDYHELKKYALVIAGSVDLVPLTIGPTSPFNIARKLYLNNLAPQESERLMNEPCKKLGISIEPAARQQLLVQTSGHPQLLQHLCHVLVERSLEEQRAITADDVQDAIEEKLFIESDNLKTLEQQTRTDETLKYLLKRVLNGEKIKYAPYQQFSLAGVGPIVSDDKYCAFRCNLYKEFLGQLLDSIPDAAAHVVEKPRENHHRPGELVQKDEIIYETTIYCHQEPGDFSAEEEENFLKRLFRCKSLTVEIEKSGIDKMQAELKGKEKLIFCYLAYKNYKALKGGSFADWKNIPDSYKYRLSSNTQNNEEQQPEWQYVLKYFEEISEKKPVDQDIRQWKFSLQRVLKPMGLADIIDSKKSGRGGGYLLKGTVTFSIKK